MASTHAASAPVRAARTPAGDPAWLIGGYDEVRALIAHSRLSWTTSAADASRCSRATMPGHPGEDGLTDLVAAADAPDHDPQQVVVRSAAGLLFAGHETTVGAKVGLSGANITVLNGTDGLGDLTAGLVSQGLRIFDSVRQNDGNDAPGSAPAVRQEGDR